MWKMSHFFLGLLKLVVYVPIINNHDWFDGMMLVYFVLFEKYIQVFWISTMWKMSQEITRNSEVIPYLQMLNHFGERH